MNLSATPPLVADTIASIVTPVILVIFSVVLALVMGRILKHFDDQHEVLVEQLHDHGVEMRERLKEQDRALSVNTQAVARIMQTMDNWEHTLMVVPALKDSVSRLEERIEAHDKYARDREKALADDIRSLQNRSRNSGKGKDENNGTDG